LIIFKLFCIEKGKDLSSANVSYLNITELCNQEYNIWSCDPINYRTEEKNNIKLLPYQVILDNIEEKSRVFFHHISKEFDMLFDNDPNSTIEIFKNPNVSDLRRPFISFMHVKSNTVVLTEECPGFICTISGVWSGTVLERKIIGDPNYIFIGQNKLVVNSNSLLSSHIRELNQNGQIIKICKLANLLHEANSGYIDESIQRFL